MDYMQAAPAGTPGAGRPGDLVRGALDRLDALRKLKEDGSSFSNPVVSGLLFLGFWNYIMDMDEGNADCFSCGILRLGC